MMLAPLSVPALLAALSLAASSPPASTSCEVSGATESAADVSLARQACEAARERFALLFGAPVPGVNVVLWDEAGYRTGTQARRAVIFWPTSRALSSRGAATVAASEYDADPWEEVLPHEIAHVLLAARFFPLGFEPPPSGYGTPFPDWLDEAVAIWAEPAGSRRTRLREARGLAPARRELGAILAASHPSASDPRVMAMRDGGPPPNNEDLIAFYPQAIALLGFVYDAGGQPAVLEMAERFLSDPDAGPAALVGLPGLARDLSGVQRAWLRWLAEESARSAAAR